MPSGQGHTAPDGLLSPCRRGATVGPPWGHLLPPRRLLPRGPLSSHGLGGLAGRTVSPHRPPVPNDGVIIRPKMLFLSH